MHYWRLRNGKDLTAPPRTGGVVKYPMAHHRVKKLWGPARQYQCIGCGSQAQEWAYDGTDPAQLSDPLGPYSIHPEFYVPMCVPCHRKFDAKGRASCTECGDTAHARGLCKHHYDKLVATPKRKAVRHH